MVQQEDFATPPWEEEDARGKWKERSRGAMRRGKAGYLKADITQRDLPTGDETVVRLLTARFGERFQHFFNDPTEPEGGLTSTNCCAPVDYKGPKDDICPICAYARQKGGREEGGSDMSHVYYLLLVMGKYQTVITRDKNDPQDPGTTSRMLQWDFETGPQIFECTGGIFNAIYKWLDEPDYPRGANGDITKYAFKIDKSKTGAAAQNVKYDAMPIPEILPPFEQLSLDTVKEKWDFIRKMCEPTRPEYAAEKLGLEFAKKGAPEQASALPRQNQTVGEELEMEPPIGQAKAPAQPVQQPVQQPAKKPANWEDAF